MNNNFDPYGGLKHPSIPKFALWYHKYQLHFELLICSWLFAFKNLWIIAVEGANMFEIICKNTNLRSRIIRFFPSFW